MKISKRNENILWGGIIILIVGLSLGSNFWYRNQLAGYGVYTKGKVIELYTKKGRYYARFEFELKGKKKVNSTEYDSSNPKIGDIYPVRYSSQYPRVNRMILEEDTLEYPDAPRIGKLKSFKLE